VTGVNAYDIFAYPVEGDTHMQELTISAVELDVISGRRGVYPHMEQRQVRPLDIYPELRLPSHLGAPDPNSLIQSLYLKISTRQGPEGFYGPIDAVAAWPIVNVLATFLQGQDALATTVVWDKLNRLDRHSRHGYLKIAISAVDNALWDLRGKAYDAPIWQLLGGPSRQRIPTYASTLGTPHDLQVVSSTARALASEGYVGQKWFLAHGPGEGVEGMQANIDLVKQLRAAVGLDVPLMFDTFMGWDLAYACMWTRAVEHLQPAWLEEPFHASKLRMYAQLQESTRIPLAAGEHLYDRAEVLPYLQQGLLAAVQSDPEWCGGVTDLIRVCALAETFGVPVIPHGHGIHAALHVVASQSPATCPMMEYLIRLMPERHRFEVNPPAPRGGAFDLPLGPGFGIELDDNRIVDRRPWPGPQ